MTTLLLVSVAIVMMACGSSTNTAAGSPPSVGDTKASESPILSLTDVTQMFCGELKNGLLPMVQQVNGLSNATTQSEVTDAIAAMSEEEQRLHALATEFQQAGDALKADDVETLASAIHDSKKGFEGVLTGETTGSGNSIVPPLQAALSGIDCSGS
jgi:hypothetical protein